VKEGHVQCKKEVKNVSGIQMENLTGRNPFEDLRAEGSIMLKRILKGMGCEGVDRDRVSLSGCLNAALNLLFLLEAGIFEELSK